MSAYREHFERGFRDGEHDAQSGTVRQLAVTRRGGHPPVVKDEDSAYYHGYKAAVAGDTRSEDSAWAAYVAKHSMRSNGPLGQRAVAHSQMVAAADVSGLPIGSILWADDRGWVVVPGGVAPIAILTERAGGRVPEGEPAASIARDYALVREGTGRVPTHGTAQRHVIAWVQAAQHAHPNPAHVSLDGKLSSRFGRQDASHVGFDGDFSFGIGTKDDRRMTQNSWESPEQLLDEGESNRSSMPGKATLSLTTLSVGVPRRRRRVYAVRMGVDDRGIATGGLHWVPAGKPEEAERFWQELTGRRVSLGRMAGNPEGEVIWQDTLLTWKLIGERGIEMVPSGEGQARARDMLEERESEHGRRRPRGLLSEQSDFLESAMGNGWSYVPPEDIGALTDATIVSQDGFIGDDGKWYPHPEVDSPIVYAHMNYAVEDPIEMWAEGKPVFWQGDVLVVSPEHRERLREELSSAMGEAYESNARKNVTAVINAFLAGRRHSEKTCSTDGWRLYSYALLIAARVDAKGEPVDVGAPGARIVVLDKKLSPSVTTSTQINSVLAAVPGAQVVDDMPYAARYLPNARKGQFKAPDSLSPAEKFFFEWAGGAYTAGASAAQRKRERIDQAKALAAAEAEAEERGWTYHWDYDQEADTSWMDEEALADFRAGRTEMLDVLLKDENGNVLASLGGVHVRATGGRDPYGRLVEAEMAQEALEAERSAGTAMALNRGQRRQARNPVFRHMDLGEVEEILGAQEIARVMSVDRPEAHARSRARDWWNANEPEYHDAYTNLSRMLKAGVLDDLVAEARGRR